MLSCDAWGWSRLIYAPKVLYKNGRKTAFSFDPISYVVFFRAFSFPRCQTSSSWDRTRKSRKEVEQGFKVWQNFGDFWNICLWFRFFEFSLSQQQRTKPRNSLEKLLWYLRLTLSCASLCSSLPHPYVAIFKLFRHLRPFFFLIWLHLHWLNNWE